MNLQQIIDQSPDIPGYGGGKWAMYAVGCCWWTSFPEDLGTNAVRLPCCPHCGSVLMQAPLEKFIESAQASPDHYGVYGLDAFVRAHSRNSATCHGSWKEYCDDIRHEGDLAKAMATARELSEKIEPIEVTDRERLGERFFADKAQKFFETTQPAVPAGAPEFVELHWHAVEGGGGGVTIVTLDDAREMVRRLNAQDKNFVHWYQSREETSVDKITELIVAADDMLEFLEPGVVKNKRFDDTRKRLATILESIFEPEDDPSPALLEALRNQGEIVVTLTHGIGEYAPAYLVQLEGKLDEALTSQGFSRRSTRIGGDVIRYVYRQFAYAR